jgi:hypothetical protein
MNVGFGCAVSVALLALAVGLKILFTDAPPTITVGHPSAHAAGMTLAELRRETGANELTGGACRLISDRSLKSILPQATDIYRATVDGAPSNSVPLRTRMCRIEFSLPHNDERRREYATVEVGVRAIGDPETVRRAVLGTGGTTTVGGAECRQEKQAGYHCHNDWLAFDVLGRLYGSGLRFAGRHGSDPGIDYTERVLAEFVRLVAAETARAA